MGLETGAQFIGELVPAWPLASDPKAEGADHLNIIKRCVQGSLGDMPGRMQFPGNNIPFQGQLVNDDYVNMINIGPLDDLEVGEAGRFTTIMGRLFVSENFEGVGPGQFQQTLVVQGLLTAQSSMNLTGTLTQTGGQNITGAVNILGGNNLAVTGNTTLTGSLSVGTSLIASGFATFQAGSHTLGGQVVTGGLTVNDSGANITGTLTLTGGANITGSVSILGGSNLIVSGNGSFTGTLSSGALTVTGGGANITGTLELNGGANIQGSVSIFSNLILASGGNQTINGGVLTVNTVSGEDRGTLLMRRTGVDAAHFIDIDNNNNASVVNGRYGIFLSDAGYFIIGRDVDDDAFQIFKQGAGIAHVIMNKLADVDPGIPGALYRTGADVRISL